MEQFVPTIFRQVDHISPSGAQDEYFIDTLT